MLPPVGPQRPSVYARLVGMAKSESVAWAVQNSLGVLFTLLFSVVWRMHFTLACVSSVLFQASCTVLSIDRTVGGRLFSASLFVGAMMSGGIIGGSISSLAWLARGQSKGLALYAGEAVRDLETVANVTLSDAIALGIVSRDNPLLLALESSVSQDVQSLESQQVGQIVGDVLKLVDSGFEVQGMPISPEFLQFISSDLFATLGSAIPAIDDGFWILLIVLFAVVCVPLSIARASENFKIGLVMAITTLFCGSQVVFACLMPLTGIRLYWTQVVTGYIKVALVNGAAMVVTALFVYVRSSHDVVREQFGESLLTCGVILSRIASNVRQIDDNESSGGKVDTYPYKDGAACKSLREEAIAMAQETLPAAGNGRYGMKKTGKDVDDAEEMEGIGLPEVPTSFKLRSSCQTIENSLGVCLFEVPLPGVSSHVGARRGDFVKLLDGLRTLLSTVCCIETIYPTGSLELARSGHDTSPVQSVMAAVAAVLGEMSSVLSKMPVFGPCKGKTLKWRPKDAQFWDDLERDIVSLAKAVREEAIQDNIRMSERGRDMMLLMMNSQTLISDVRAFEVLTAIALDVGVETGASAVEAAMDYGNEKETQKKQETERKGLKERIAGNGYLPALLVHSILLSGGAQYAIIVLSTINFFKGVFAFVRSRAERARIVRDVYVQFAVKFWLATSLTIMGIVLILWRAKFAGSNQLQNAYDITYFFFVWQPIYFWLTVSICVQFQVEAAVMRAVLRTTMTALGGTLGYCAMLNGNLAQNPYWICGIVIAVNGAFHLLCPIRPLRYSIFLANFTFNAVVVCQYYGCPPCDLPGETNIYGGKVLSTMLGSIWAILVSWLVLPYYTSQKMLDIEYEVMNDSLSLITSTWRSSKIKGEVRVEVAGTDTTNCLNLATVDKLIDERLVAVQKEIENNTINKDQLLLIAWTLLPTPSVVELLVKRLERVGVFLREYAQITTSSIGGSHVGDQSTSPEFQKFIEVVYLRLEDCNTTTEALMKSVRSNFDAKNRAELNQTRVDLSINIQALETTLDALTADFVEWDRHRKTGIREAELKTIARSRLVVLAFKEFFVIAVLLAETEATVDRDLWYSAWSSWFGRRPV